MPRVRSLLWVASVVVVLAAGGCGDEKPASPSTAGATTTTILSGFDAPFEPFTVDGLFTVDLPGTPVVSTEEATTPSGPMTVDLYFVEVASAAIGVGVSMVPVDIASIDVATFLSETVGGVANGIGGSVESQTDVAGAALPTRDAIVTATTQGQDIVVFVRVTLVGDRLFQFQSLSLAADRPAAQADFERLVASFVPVS